jgi:hypothetical protein
LKTIVKSLLSRKIKLRLKDAGSSNLFAQSYLSAIFREEKIKRQ